MEVHGPKARPANWVEHPKSSQCQLVDRVCPEDELTAGEILVAAEFSGAQEGTLSECAASIWQDDGFLRVRQITVCRRLGDLRASVYPASADKV